MKKEEKEEEPIKIILLGESGVGKTNLIYAFIGHKGHEDSTSTVTSSSIEGKIDYDDNKSYKYCMWDTAGQEKFRSINKIFFRDAKIILIVYAIDNRNSFDNTEFWINYVKENITEDKYTIALIANKSDLYENQMVMEEEAKEAAEKFGIDFFTTSAKQDANGFRKYVNGLIKEYIRKYLVKENENEKDKKKNLKIKKRKKNKNKFC